MFAWYLKAVGQISNKTNFTEPGDWRTREEIKVKFIIEKGAVGFWPKYVLNFSLSTPGNYVTLLKKYTGKEK